MIKLEGFAYETPAEAVFSMNGLSFFQTQSHSKLCRGLCKQDKSVSLNYQ